MAAPKPTISEYDRVYGNFRRYSDPLYVKLRTWILDQTGSGGGGTVVDIDYADLLALFNAGTLVPATIYCIQDFRSINIIPNAGGATATGAIEPLCVTAISATDLAPVAASMVNQTDLLIYQIDNTEFGADRGRILYRESDRNNKAHFDFRAFEFRRWETAPASGIFTVTTDNGGAFQDALAFIDASCANLTIEPRIILAAQVLSNNQIQGGATDVLFRGAASDNTLLGLLNINTTFDFGASQNVLTSALDCQIGLNTTNVTAGTPTGLRIGANCDNITIGSGTSWISIGSNCSDITITGNSDSIKIGDNCSLITFTTGLAAQGVTFESFCTNISIDQSAVNVTFEKGVNTITAGSNLTRTTFKQNAFNWTIGDNLDQSQIGRQSQGIIGDTNSRIKVGDDCAEINVGDTNTDIRIGDNCGTITIGDSCQNIELGNGCSGITAEDSVTSWTVEAGTATRLAREGALQRHDSPRHARMYMIHNFTTDGGAVGTYVLDQVGQGAVIVYGAVRALTTLVSAGAATVALGVDTDAPTGILAATAYNSAAKFNGNMKNINNLYLDTTIQPVAGTTTQRDVILTVGGAAITSGIVQLWIEIYYQ